MLTNFKITICLGGLLSFCANSMASPLVPGSGIGGPDIAAISSAPAAGLGSSMAINPVSQATTVSNVIANTDIAPQVNVAPTIPIPYPSYYGVPVPVASGYPFPVPSVFKRWDGGDCCDECCDGCCDGCCDDSCNDSCDDGCDGGFGDGFLGGGFCDGGFGHHHRDCGFDFSSGSPCDCGFSF